MDAKVAAPAPSQSSTLSARASPNKNTASQPPPRNIVTSAQDSLERAIAATPPRNITAAQGSLQKAIAASSPKDIVTAAQNSLDRAIAAAPQTPPRNFVAQNSIEKTLAQNNPVQTVTAIQQSLNRTVVTPQETWQNVAVPSLPQHTLPAVQDFLQIAFETVQRSKQTAMAAAKDTLQNATNQSTTLIATGVQHPLPPTDVATPLSPQISLPAPFQSLQKAATSQPHSIGTSKLQTASLPNKDSLEIKQTMTKITEASTSLQHTTSTSEIKKASTSKTGTISKSQSYPGYTFYNTTRLNNPKQTLSPPKRSFMIAKRHNPVAETAPEIGNSLQNPTSEMLLAQLTPKVRNLSTSEKMNSGEKGGPLKHNNQGSSRVAQTFKEFRERGTNGPQSVRGAQNAHSNNGGSNRNWRRLKTNEEGVEEIDPKRRVLVSGFPPYTQSQDLTRVLSRFGNCQVVSCRNRLAVVTFDSEADARSAMRAADDISIYGEFVEIKPYTNPRHVDELYRAYKKVISTQKGQDITMPDKIDLSGDFFHQLENIQNAIRLTREQVQGITNLYMDLEMVLQKEWPGCVAIPFGSIPTGLGIKSSDADCYVEVPAAQRERERGSTSSAAGFVTRARRLLHRYPDVFTHLVAIPRANTPILKFRHAPSGFHCDVSAKTPLGAQNSKLIKLLLEHDPRLAHAAVLLKYWAKVHDLSGTGRLTNYALTMMVIFYLQQPGVGLVPAVERLQRDPASRYIVDHWNAGFSPRKLPGPPNPVTLPDLIGGFFEFYAGFDFEKLVVCPYLGTALPKAAFDSPHTLPLELARYVGNVRDNLAGPIRNTTSFCVQDPFEQSHNVASSVGAKLAAEIKAYLKFAADAYSADRANGCENFLRTVLLTRPKQTPQRVSPYTNVPLIPRVRGHFKDPDWRGILRSILLDVIFEKILKLRLERDEKKEREGKKEEKEEREGKKEEKEEREGKKEEREGKKERGRRQGKGDIEMYTGAATKPVWRRKKQNCVRPSPEELVARQAALTDNILAARHVASLEFELELWFREEPRSCSLGLKMLAGDMDAFRHFVSFLHTVMLDWFRVLVKPHLAPVRETLADAAERSGSEAECTIRFEREPPREPSPPRLVLDPADITRHLDKVTLNSDTDKLVTDTDGSKKEP